MADTTQATSEEVEYSEDKIAVHWREEEYVPPPEQYGRRRTPTTIRSSSGSLPSASRSASRSTRSCSRWDKKWDEIVDTSNPPFFKWWVGGRLNACVNCVDRHLESRGDENAIDLGSGARGRRDAGDHLPRAASPRQRVRGAAEGLLRRQAAATASRSTCRWSRPAGGDARVRAARRDPLAGVRRLQRRRLRPPDGRCREHDPGHDRLLLPQRRADRPQDQGRRGGRGGARGGDRGREGARVAAHPRRVPLRDARWSRAATTSSTSCCRLRGQAGRAGVDAGRGHAVPDVHERHDRPAEGRSALDRRLPVLRRRDVEVLPGHPSRRHVLVLRRHRLDHRSLLHRLRAAGARDDDA